MIDQISYSKKINCKKQIEVSVYCLNKSSQMVEITRNFKRLHESNEQLLKKEALNFIF